MERKRKMLLGNALIFRLLTDFLSSLKLTAFRYRKFVTQKKICPRGHRSRSRSEKPERGLGLFETFGKRLVGWRKKMRRCGVPMSLFWSGFQSLTLITSFRTIFFWATRATANWFETFERRSASKYNKGYTRPFSAFCSSTLTTFGPTFRLGDTKCGKCG